MNEREDYIDGLKNDLQTMAKAGELRSYMHCQKCLSQDANKESRVCSLASLVCNPLPDTKQLECRMLGHSCCLSHGMNEKSVQLLGCAHVATCDLTDIEQVVIAAEHDVYCSMCLNFYFNKSATMLKV